MKHLVDINEQALARAKDHLGTPTIKATVNAALRLAAGTAPTDADFDEALDQLATVEFEDRAAAWR